VTAVVLLACWALLIALFTLLFLMPRWCFRSLHRHRMWRLRDEIVDCVVDGVLPADHEAIQQLVGRIGRSIRLAPSVTLLRLIIIDRITGRTPPRVREMLDARDGRGPCDLSELTVDQCELIKSYNERIDILRIGTTLTGSWLGIGVVMLAIPLALADIGARTLRQTLAQAVDEASATSFGRHVGERARLAELHVHSRSQVA
jgi:hypothetical protein